MTNDEEFKAITDGKHKLTNEEYIVYLENVLKVYIKTINEPNINKSERRTNEKWKQTDIKKPRKQKLI